MNPNLEYSHQEGSCDAASPSMSPHGNLFELPYVKNIFDIKTSFTHFICKQYANNMLDLSSIFKVR